MLRLLYEYVPLRVRQVAKALVGRSGHRQHFLDPIRARHLARTKKRMDIVSAKMAHRLSLANITSLEGKRCMEFGCGMVPTELVYFWTLGASGLVAVDYNRIARFNNLPRPAGFRVACIEYKAPFDMSKEYLAGLDLIHSESVLEHVAPWEVAPLLENLAKSLAPNGVMIHSIDLRDHLDPGNSPFRFLDDPSYDPSMDFDARGNRMRRSDWLTAFADVPGLQTACLREASTPGRTIPNYSDDDSALFVIMVSRRR